jgi:hypothetical protein
MIHPVKISRVLIPLSVALTAGRSVTFMPASISPQLFGEEERWGS